MGVGSRRGLVKALTLTTAILVSGVVAFAEQTPEDGSSDTPAVYLVGAAKRSIDPDPDGTFAGQPVYIGGSGMGDTRSRIAPPGLSVRAVAFAASDDPDDAVVIASLETIGHFNALDNGPWGIVDIRREVEARTGIDAQRVIISSNHSHRAPDTLGLWWGVPDEYLAYIAEQAAGAIEDAWEARVPASIRVGSVADTDLALNDYAGAAGNEIVDDGVRALQARRIDDGAVVATLVNASTHSIAASGLDAFHPDWPGHVGLLAEDRYGGEGIGLIGAIGRVAPFRSPGQQHCAHLPGPYDKPLCQVTHYADRVLGHAHDALEEGRTLTGPAVVRGHSYLILDTITNPLVLALLSTPADSGLALYRATTPPWMTGNVIATTAYSARIGDVLVSGVPGEIFPSIHEVVRTSVPAGEHFIAGLAGDMLGYIVHPFPDAYPEVMRRAVFSGPPDDPTAWEPGPDDKYLFNTSFTLGEQLTCTLLRGAGEVFDRGLDHWNNHSGCEVFRADLQHAPGSDVEPPIPTVTTP